ncbi:MAG: helix-turn-helix domain-containing protein [Acidobacteria bacterium]|nr:helix-turn-helix domain-containing protein [Acidobacteriota bacterium]
MTGRPRRKDWEALGLEPGADLALVKRAHRHRRSLYDKGSLATYTLLEDDERTTMLSRIDTAYRRIVGTEPFGSRLGPFGDESTSDRSEAPTGPPPDSHQEPGAYLRHHRLSQGLTLQQIAAEIRVGAAILAQIENEEFEDLPAPVFVRGFVLQLARALRLSDAEELAGQFLVKMVG